MLNRSTFVAGWSTPNLGVALIIGAGLLFSLGENRPRAPPPAELTCPSPCRRSSALLLAGWSEVWHDASRRYPRRLDVFSHASLSDVRVETHSAIDRSLKSARSIFASKVNPLTILTGMSYEHLNVGLQHTLVTVKLTVREGLPSLDSLGNV